MAARPVPTHAEPEFYPDGSQRDGKTFVIEISPPHGFDETGFEIVVWRGNSGVSLQIAHPTIEKARRVARVLYHLNAADYAEGERRAKARYAEMDARMKVEWAERQAREDAEHTARLAKVTDDTPRIEKAICPTCDHADDPDEFEQPVYECSRCGGNQVGEGENRCESDNIFMAKVGDLACPSCQEPCDEMETVTGVEIDGAFITEAELAEVPS